jgi:hypothetical protein
MDLIFKKDEVFNAIKEEKLFRKTRGQMRCATDLSRPHAGLHFADLSIADIEGINDGQTLMEILQENRIQAPEHIPHFAFFKGYVMSEKFCWLHEMVYDERLCGSCRKVVLEGQLRCSQCMYYHYCSRQCQRAHWKAHKPLCAILGQKKRRRIPETIPGFRSEIHVQMIDSLEAKETLFEEFTASIEPLVNLSPVRSADSFMVLPRNLTETHGPEVFFKFVDYVFGLCETRFVRQQEAWLHVLADFLDPFWPEDTSNGEPEALGLRPNAKAFLEDSSRLDRFLKVILNDSDFQGTAYAIKVLYNLSCYEKNFLYPDHPPRNFSASHTGPVFGELAIDVHLAIVGYLDLEEKLMFGRACQRAAHVVSLEISDFSRGKYEIIDRFIEHHESLLEAEFHDVRDIEDRVMSLDDLGVEQLMEWNIRCNELRTCIDEVHTAQHFIYKHFWSNLKALKILQGKGPECLFTKILVLRHGGYLYKFSQTGCRRIRHFLRLLEMRQIDAANRLGGIDVEADEDDE